MKAVLLINLGTPKAPTTLAVKQYLKQFLSDPKVIHLPNWARLLLVNGFILPFRSKRSAKLYQQIWTPQGSPLLLHSQALLAQLKTTLGKDFAVALGMRYGQPSIEAALKELEQYACDSLIVLPLFPQYSISATESALQEAQTKSSIKKITLINSFFEKPGYISSMAAIIRENTDFQPDYFLLSYHGPPNNHLDKRYCQQRACDQQNPCPSLSGAGPTCYRAQCFKTAELLARELGLTNQEYEVAFQSRLGGAAWIKPYTDKILIKLAQAGVKKLVVFCPSFVADCLETLEEIGVRANAQWRKLGGDKLKLIPSLNSHPLWVKAVTAMIAEAEKQC